jgi:uncharacterized protein involved in outer membrane biogenesis
MRVANPRPYTGNFMTADAFVLRYKLGPLLSGRLEVEELSLKKPMIAMAMDAKGGFNYEKLGPAAAASGQAAPAAEAAPAAPAALPLTLVLSKLAVEDLSVSMTDHTNLSLMNIDDADFTSSFEVVGASARGKGDAKIATVSMADMLYLRDISTTLDASSDAIKLAPLKARIAGGETGGDLTVDLKDFKYTMNLDLKGASVKKLIEEAKSAGGVDGTLAAKASFEGTGGMETMKGKGRAEITGCKMENVKVLQMLSSVLRVPELASPDFKECLVEFTMNGAKIATPVLSAKGAAIQITGKGTSNMDTSAIAYDLNLALANSLLDKMPAKEMRAAFKDRGDGFGAVDFKVWGTTLAPQNDLAGRVGKAAATEAAKAGVQKLLGKKKFF